jgi:hypothetical protein
MTMRKTLTVLVSAAVALTLASCGSDGADNQSTGASSSGPTTAAEEPAEALDAPAVLAHLQAAGLPITSSVVITENNDPNNLIGRPGQYTSKVVFADERTGVAVSETEPSNDSGGSVEVFADEAAAQARSEYITRVQAEMGPIAGVEYQYLAGPALVRVTGDLPPSVTADYESAVAELG